MITFKSHSDLEKLDVDDPALPVMQELVGMLIDDFNEPGHPYSPEDFGYIVLIEPEDVDRELTGKSTLTYQIGTLPDSSIHLRISKNTGAGFFNDEWIALKDIQEALEKIPEGQPLTSFLLQPLVKGKSVNTPAFLMAALTHERLLRVLKGKKRGHELLDPEGFKAKMDQLVSAKSTTGGMPRKTVRKTTVGTTKRPTKKTGGNAVIKKRAAVKRKQRKTG